MGDFSHLDESYIDTRRLQRRQRNNTTWLVRASSTPLRQPAVRSSLRVSIPSPGPVVNPESISCACCRDRTGLRRRSRSMADVVDEDVSHTFAFSIITPDVSHSSPCPNDLPDEMLTTTTKPSSTRRPNRNWRLSPIFLRSHGPVPSPPVSGGQRTLLLERSKLPGKHTRMLQLGDSVQHVATMRRALCPLAPGKWRRSLMRHLPDNTTIRSWVRRSFVTQTNHCRAAVLRECGQTEPLPFDDVYPEHELRNCRKIGESVGSEVFRLRTGERAVVLKIIPIEGAALVNGCTAQNGFATIHAQIVVTALLGGLRHGERNATAGFVQLLRVRCVRGAYPNKLLLLWQQYRDEKGTQNDHPEAFDDRQLYVVLEFTNGGDSLEEYRFSGAGQALSVLKQIALTLAVAEEALQFEHRDLHCGNILIASTQQRHATYRLRGQCITVPTLGVTVTLIDFAMSRLAHGDGNVDSVIYSDLALEEALFRAGGDYQFDVYRLMRHQAANEWRSFRPLTNVLWLHYVSDKLVDDGRYTKRKTARHAAGLEEIRAWRDGLLELGSRSAADLVLNAFFAGGESQMVAITRMGGG